MLILLLLTLWTDDGVKVVAKEVPSLSICKAYGEIVAAEARKQKADVSINCVVVGRPISA